MSPPEDCHEEIYRLEAILEHNLHQNAEGVLLWHMPQQYTCQEGLTSIQSPHHRQSRPYSSVQGVLAIAVGVLEVVVGHEGAMYTMCNYPLLQGVLDDEHTAAVQQCSVILAVREELPDLGIQGLGDAGPDEGAQTLGVHWHCHAIC